MEEKERKKEVNILLMGIFAVLAIVFIVLFVLKAGVSGEAVAPGTACCTTQVWRYAPEGYSQYEAITREAQCLPGEVLEECCLRTASGTPYQPVRVLGAHWGPCGMIVTPTITPPYTPPYITPYTLPY